jgi:hypothetical protein
MGFNSGFKGLSPLFILKVSKWQPSPSHIRCNVSRWTSRCCLIDAGNYRMSHTHTHTHTHTHLTEMTGTIALQQDGTPPLFPINLCTHFSVLSTGKWLDIYDVFPVPLVSQAWHFSVLVTGDSKSACRFFCWLQPSVRCSPPTPPTTQAVKYWTEGMLWEIWEELR